MPGGFTGVDIFFVISGYLITRIILADLESGEFSFTNFWIRRARRILPALLFTLIIVTVVALYTLLPSDLDEYGQLLSHTIFFATNIYLSIEGGYFDSNGLDNPLLHLWSLSVEEQYYVIWPILLTVAVRFLKLRHVIGGVAILCCLSLAYSEWASIHAPKLAFYGLPSRAFELLIGAGIASGNLGRIERRILAEILSISGIVLISLGMVFINEKTKFPGIEALIPCIGAALIIISGGGSRKTLIEGVLSSSLFVRIGKISYSWYLWHWPPLAFMRYYVGQPLSAVEVAVALAAGLGMAVVSWRFVERPFRGPVAPSEFRRGFLPVAVSACVALLVLGTAFQKLDGLPARMDKDTLAMLDQFPGSSSLGCNGPVEGKGNLQICRFGKADAAEPSIMLWGDSHADHYLPAIANIAAAEGVSGLAHVSLGCRPFIMPERLDRSSGRSRTCPKANEETLAKLLARPEITVVVLAARWSTNEIVPGEAEELDVFGRNLERTITALEENGKTVIILGQVPQFPLELRNCMTRQVRFGRKIPNCEAVPISDLDRYQTGVWTSMQAISQRHGKVAFFAPQNQLCNGAGAICRATDAQGLPLYRDDDHLSLRGALFLERSIGQSVAPLLRSSRPRFAETESP